MCKQVYLGADRPLPLVPWQPEAPGLHVREVDATNPEAACMNAVRRWFRGRYVYHVGSWMGCSCGLSYRDRSARDPEIEAGMRERYAARGEDYDARQRRFAEMDEQGRKDVRDLAAYLARVTQEGDVELYACMVGEEDDEPQTRDVVSPSEFGGELFDFRSGAYFLVTSQESLPRDAPPRGFRQTLGPPPDRRASRR
jgi:hypothetical protein